MWPNICGQIEPLCEVTYAQTSCYNVWRIGHCTVAVQRDTHISADWLIMIILALVLGGIAFTVLRGMVWFMAICFVGAFICYELDIQLPDTTGRNDAICTTHECGDRVGEEINHQCDTTACILAIVHRSCNTENCFYNIGSTACVIPRRTRYSVADGNLHERRLTASLAYVAVNFRLPRSKKSKEVYLPICAGLANAQQYQVVTNTTLS